MSTTAFYPFGSGVLWGTVAGSTPQRFGTLQDIQIGVEQSIKELVGGNQFPVDLARGKGKITFAAKFAELNGALVSSLFFNNATTTGQLSIAYAEAQTVPAVSTYTVTTTNSATWVRDLGVRYATTGLALKMVASGPTVGQYSVAAGVYTFAAADASAAVLIDYTYQTSATGVSMQFTNQLLGIAPVFSLSLLMPRQSQQASIYMPNCMADKLTLPTKLDDYTILDFSGQAFADASGNLVKIGFPQ